MTRSQLTALLEKARQTNNHRDQIDRQSGLRPASQDDPDSLARTIILAIQCGLLTDDPNAIAEALVLCVDLEARLRNSSHLFQPWLPSSSSQ